MTNKSLISRLRNAQKIEQPSPAALRDKIVGVQPRSHEELTVFMVAGEHSGDVLGGALMRELVLRRKGLVRFIGVGGEAMEAQGLTSLFPLGDIAVMGPVAILKALPRLTKRVYQTVAAGIAANPDIIVIIDSPEFTHRVSRRLRAKLPSVPIIDYVCPSVWAWRSGRAKVMARHIDHVLTLLPFEPAALDRLGGPSGTYVGHPLSERLADLKSIDKGAWRSAFEISQDETPLVVLPGSRSSEVEKLVPVFGETIQRLTDRGVKLRLLMPCVPHLKERIMEMSADWPAPCMYLDGEDAKFAAFRVARAALAASGTVTLELGVAGTPMVVAYRLDGVAVRLRFLLEVHSIVLANLVLDENAFPEYVQEDCTPEKLSDALMELFEETPERAAQLEALVRLETLMQPGDRTPSERAADVVMAYASADPAGGRQR